jgi:uncharacterized protein
MQVLRVADYRIMPWKNGLGSTTEIAVSPGAEGLDGFDWRISMARVASDGPFSRFPGIDRTLLVLDGDGIDLAVQGSTVARLDRRSAAHGFAGDVPTSATLLGGPIVDLNIMTRRTAFRHSVSRFDLAGARMLPAPLGPTVVFVEQGVVSVQVAATLEVLAYRDTLLLDAQSPAIRVESTTSARVVLVELRAVPLT